ncbi:hypothetical protein PR048_023279 [Dryococelus australis]|uniref:Uncharacterized protein n=1 Tax=Dryococelus australis TaxID=614101 RepID=A0ABQ9GTQ2_9NEOP|nr:hypothetical protein PR048_023279 [Dryococelus australis]
MQFTYSDVAMTMCASAGQAPCMQHASDVRKEHFCGQSVLSNSCYDVSTLCMLMLYAVVNGWIMLLWNAIAAVLAAQYQPPRSPDLNPLHFYLWGHLKAFVFATRVHALDTVRDRILAGCETYQEYTRDAATYPGVHATAGVVWASELRVKPRCGELESFQFTAPAGNPVSVSMARGPWDVHGEFVSCSSGAVVGNHELPSTDIPACKQFLVCPQHNGGEVWNSKYAAARTTWQSQVDDDNNHYCHMSCLKFCGTCATYAAMQPRGSLLVRGRCPVLGRTDLDVEGGRCTPSPLDITIDPTIGAGCCRRLDAGRLGAAAAWGDRRLNDGRLEENSHTLVTSEQIVGTLVTREQLAKELYSLALHIPAQLDEEHCTLARAGDEHLYAKTQLGKVKETAEIAERRMEGARVCEAELVASSSHQTALGRARSAARLFSVYLSAWKRSDVRYPGGAGGGGGRW